MALNRELWNFMVHLFSSLMVNVSVMVGFNSTTPTEGGLGEYRETCPLSLLNTLYIGWTPTGTALTCFCNMVYAKCTLTD